LCCLPTPTVFYTIPNSNSSDVRQQLFFLKYLNSQVGNKGSVFHGFVRSGLMLYFLIDIILFVF
jgi:hypothetical protein